MTLSLQSSAERFRSAQGYPAIHALSPSGLISVQLQLLSYQLHILMRGQREPHQTEQIFSSFVQEKKKLYNCLQMNRVFFRYSAEVMWKRSAKGSNNNTVVNHYFHAPLGRNFSFYWFLTAENLVHTNTFLSAHGCEGREKLRPEWAETSSQVQILDI